jgi:hypothetical protein
MLRGRVADLVAVSVLAAAVTAVMAAPVLRAPSERLFGMEIVGRHHDPFTVMGQFERPVSLGVYSQPITDIPGALLARVSGAVARRTTGSSCSRLPSPRLPRTCWRGTWRSRRGARRLPRWPSRSPRFT